MKILSKRTEISCIIIFCVLMLFSACNANIGDGSSYNTETVSDSQVGISLKIPKSENDILDKSLVDLSSFPVETQPNEGIAITYYAPGFWASSRTVPADELRRLLFTVQYYDEAVWNAWIADGKAMSDITGYPTNEIIGQKDGMIYIFSQTVIDEGSLTGEDLELYRGAVKLIPQMRKSIKLIPRAAENIDAFPAFSAETLSGEIVKSSIISDHKLTMISFWATFCGSCIEEMPDLQKMSSEMPAGTQLIGIVGDASGEDSIKLSKQITKEKGVSYLNLVPDEALKNFIDSNIAAYPTTIFVDSENNIVGAVIVGEHSSEFYTTELENRLKHLENT